MKKSDLPARKAISIHQVFPCTGTEGNMPRPSTTAAFLSGENQLSKPYPCEQAPRTQHQPAALGLRVPAPRPARAAVPRWITRSHWARTRPDKRPAVWHPISLKPTELLSFPQLLRE